MRCITKGGGVGGIHPITSTCLLLTALPTQDSSLLPRARRWKGGLFACHQDMLICGVN
jgi:hypothetical protein